LPAGEDLRVLAVLGEGGDGLVQGRRRDVLEGRRLHGGGIYAVAPALALVGAQVAQTRSFDRHVRTRFTVGLSLRVLAPQRRREQIFCHVGARGSSREVWKRTGTSS